MLQYALFNKYYTPSGGEIDLSNYYTKDEVNRLLQVKQNLLVSGTNIKTINNISLLGDGNIDVGGGTAYTSGDGISISEGVISVNDTIARVNELPDMTNYYNKTEVDNLIPDMNDYQEKLVSGTNIKTINNESLLGNGNIEIEGANLDLQDVLNNGGNATDKGIFLRYGVNPTNVYNYNSYMQHEINNTDEENNLRKYVRLSCDDITLHKGVRYGNPHTLFRINFSNDIPEITFTDNVKTAFKNALDLSGGGSYTAGNGIDITNDIISVDNTIALKSELPDMNDYQEKLVSGTNIKTINNESILGTGNITIQGGDGAIDKIKVNGVEQSITNKSVDLWVGEVKQEGTPRYNVNTSGLSVKGKVRYVDNSGMNTSGNGTLKLVKDESGVKATALIESSSGMFKTGFNDIVLPDKNYIDTQDNAKQDTLVSGTNIKTINNQSILGSGNIDIGSGTGGNANLNLDIPNETATISNNTEAMAFDLANERLIVAKPNEYYKELSLGGSSYIAGTGIDITNDTISVDSNDFKTINNQNIVGNGNINIKPNTWDNWIKGQDTTGWNYMYRLDTTNKMLDCYMKKTLNIGCTATSGNFFRSEPVYIDHLKEFSDNLGLGRLEIYDVNINVIKSGYPIFTSINSINGTSSDFDLSFYLVSGGSRNATNYEVMVHFISSIESY